MRSPVVLAFLAFALTLATSALASQLVIKDASRSINVGGGFVRVGVTLSIENFGTPAKRFQLAYLSHDVSTVAASLNDEFLEVSEPQFKVQDGANITIVDVTLPKPLNAGETLTIKSEALITRQLVPFQQITQRQDNHLLYRDSTHIISPYTIKSQRTRIDGARQILKYTDVAASSLEGSVVTYGPFSNASPFKNEPFSLYFISTAPLLRVTSLLKEVEVSHWGNVAVEEQYAVMNAGNELSHGFSRVDFMFGQRGNSFNTISQLLAGDAFEPYYRDVIGNISSSNFYVHKDIGRAKLDLGPRFIMFGGWKTVFTLGYNLPLSNYLSVLPDGRHQLEINFSTDFIEETFIDDFELRFVLPEGISDIDFTFPFEVKENERTIRPTYLDTVGRTVLSFSKSNILNIHNRLVQIRYRYPSSNLIQDPLLLISAFFALFITLIICFRLDFSLPR